MDTEAERASIGHVVAWIEEYTNDIEAAEGMFDDISLKENTTTSTDIELVVNGDFEVDDVGVLGSENSLTDWSLSRDNGGTCSIEPGKYLKMKNADGTNDYASYNQHIKFSYDENKNYLISGKFRLILDGTNKAQMVSVLYRFEDISNNTLGRLIF
ncbi:MAG: hypothetical protein ACXADY_01965, partial [Candidatus Hodarchaeales archaeon]